MISLNEGYGPEDETENLLSFLSGGFNIYPEKGGLSIDYTINKKDLSEDEQEALLDKAYDDTQNMRDEMGMGEKVNAFAFEIEEEDGYLIAKFFFEVADDEADIPDEMILPDEDSGRDIFPS